MDDAANPSGISPTEYKVLIAPKAAADKIGSIIVPDQTKDAEKYATMEGVVIATSPLAFSYARPDEWEAVGAVPPKPGDRVLFAKYAGVLLKGPRDGKDYRLVNDKDVVATIED